MKNISKIKVFFSKNRGIYYYIPIALLFFIGVYNIFINFSEKSNLASQVEILSHRIDSFIFDNSIQEKFIGKVIEFDSLFLLNRIKIKSEKSIYKIAIIPDVGSCDQCYKKTIAFYNSLLIKNNGDKNIELVIVCPSSNIQYAEWSMSEFIEENNTIFIDTSFQYSVNLGIPLSATVVLLLNSENICLYSYSVDSEYPNKDYLKSKIFRRFMNI